MAEWGTRIAEIDKPVLTRIRDTSLIGQSSDGGDSAKIRHWDKPLGRRCLLFFVKETGLFYCKT